MLTLLLLLTGCHQDAGFTDLGTAYPADASTSHRTESSCMAGTALDPLPHDGVWRAELQLTDTGDVLPALWMWTDGGASYWSATEGELEGAGEYEPADHWQGTVDLRCGVLYLYGSHGAADHAARPQAGRLAPVTYGGGWALHDVVLVPFVTRGGWPAHLLLYPHWNPHEG